MSKIGALTNIMLFLAIVAYVFVTHTYNSELTERVSSLESMVKENKSNGIVYGRYLERSHKTTGNEVNNE